MCRYRKHLESNNIIPIDVLEKCRFLIGQFHVLPHGGKCIQEMQPYTTRGNGRVDGEVLERRWATFRLHMNSFKQMSPGTRTVFMERLIWYVYIQFIIIIIIRWQYSTHSNQIAQKTVKKYKEVINMLQSLAVAADLQPESPTVARLDFSNEILAKKQEIILAKLRFKSQEYHLYKSLVITKVILIISHLCS
jgi:hypothetical protein